MKKVLIILICIFAFPTFVMASTCDKISKTPELVNNVNINYSILFKDNSPIFSIYITNLTSDMVVINNTESKVYRSGDFSSGNSLTIRTTKSGQYTFNIYSKTCKTNLRSISVYLPKYNRHYKDQRCKGFENYSLCQRWSEYQANDKTFDNDIKKLIADNNTKKEEVEEVKTKTKVKWYKLVSEWFVNYWWAFVILMLLIMAIFYVIRANQKKKEYNFKL